MSLRGRNQVTVSGKAGGPVVVLAHGFGCDQDMWRLVVPLLERDATVVLFDHVGAGRSDLSPWSRERCSTLDGHTEDVREICRESPLGPVMFVGPAVGHRGGFGAEDIDELLGSLDANHLGWSGTMAPMIMGNPECPELGEELTNSFLSDNRDDLAHVTVPTPAAPRETAAAIADFVGATR
ncbi:alpha/beta fold hydrolase [Streptomyces sp. NPDC050508]|uniref:alpha/beta fold hydrolase n=1 Tax=Streptomyces sp. NPDC050508 TaxID=3155405 RepID=UPI00342BB626